MEIHDVGELVQSIDPSPFLSESILGGDMGTATQCSSLNSIMRANPHVGGLLVESATVATSTMFDVSGLQDREALLTCEHNAGVLSSTILLDKVCAGPDTSNSGCTSMEPEIQKSNPDICRDVL